MLKIINPCWRQAALTEPEQALLDALLLAHDRSARRANVSTQILLHAAHGSGRYLNALATALLSMGDAHAPLSHTMVFLSRSDWELELNRLLTVGAHVPGWGSSFVKKEKDVIWGVVEGLLNDHWKDMADHLEIITRKLHEMGRQIYPNPSAYTAAAALILELPAALAPYLFVVGRIDAWTEMLAGKGGG